MPTSTPASAFRSTRPTIVPRVVRSVGITFVALRDAGRSGTEIGQALGITKQSAWEKYSGED